MLKFILALAATLSLWISPSLATVEYDKETRVVVLKGSTTVFQSIEFFNIISASPVDTVYLYGPGGDMDSGLTIGRLIKTHKLRVIIPSGMRCVSACAFAAMGAEDLIVDGKLLFHRPFWMAVPTSVTLDEMASRFSIGILRLSRYAVDMGFPVYFIEQLEMKTNRCDFMVISDTGELDKHRGPPTSTSWQVYRYENLCP